MPKRRLLTATVQHTQEYEMRKSAMVAISLVVLASSSAFAQGKTRAEIYQELIEAQQNGLTTSLNHPTQKHLAQRNAAEAPNTGMAESTAN
jgi:hypothetical protein